MEEFFKAFAQSKIPSLLLIGTALFTGAFIVINSKGSQNVILIGLGVILVGIVLTIIAFSDYRNREYFESIIQQYSIALNNISKTHSAFESKTQQTLSSDFNTIGLESESYSIEKDKSMTGI